MSELALASFAAANDAHLVGEPRSARFASFKADFDARAELERLANLGFRFLARSDPCFPLLLRAIHDPPPGLFVRGVEPDGPADRAELEIGMVLTDIAGRPARALADVRTALAGRPADRDLVLRVLRGAKAEFRVILAETLPPPDAAQP